MSKYQALIDALEAPGLSDCPWVAFGPSNGAAPPDYYNEVVAVRGDAQVQVICHAPRGLDGACTADTTYIAEANPATIRAILADLERAEKDAERYRWLRAEHERHDPVCHLSWKQNSDRNGSEWVNTANLDAAIDAALAQMAGG